MFCILFLLISCIKDADLDLPPAEINYVLNGILHPDSLVSVYISKSNYLEDTTDYPIITNAKVIFYENETQIGQVEYSQTGNYTIDYKPKENQKYSVKATFDDGHILFAEDKIPSKLDLNYYFPSCNRDSGRDFGLRIIGNTDNSFVWSYFYSFSISRKFVMTDSGEINIEYLSERIEPSPESRDIRLDDFNASFDNTSGYFDYYKYIRISSFESNTTNNFIFGLSFGSCSSDSLILKDSEKLLAIVMNTSIHYDRYLKSSLQHYLLNEQQDTPNPFSEPVRIYSNVEGGLGIFAAYNSTQVSIR